MNSTDFTGWVGVIAGLGRLLWDVLKRGKTGPRVTVSVVPNTEAYGLATWLTGRAPCVIVEARNVGGGMTTVTGLVGYYYDKWYKRQLHRKPTRTIIVEDPILYPLPHELKSGGRWLGVMRQNRELEKMSRMGCLYVGIFHSTAKKPVMSRLVILRDGCG